MTEYFIQPLQSSLAKPYLKEYIINKCDELNERAAVLKINNDAQKMLDLLKLHRIDQDVILLADRVPQGWAFAETDHNDN